MKNEGAAKISLSASNFNGIGARPKNLVLLGKYCGYYFFYRIMNSLHLNTKEFV